MRKTVSEFLDRPWVGNAILAVILFNAVILGLETSPAVMATAGGLIKALDQICLAIFVVELLAKLFARGGAFFRSGWNLFDAVIIGISLSPAGAGLSVLRALADPASAARGLRCAVAAPRGGSFYSGAARHGLGLLADGHYLLHRRGDRDQALWAVFPRMVRHAWRLALLAVPGDDAWKAGRWVSCAR